MLLPSARRNWFRGALCILLVGAVSATTSAKAGAIHFQNNEQQALFYPGIPLSQLKAVDSGAGLVTCEPVVPAAFPADLADFGAGCSRWLQFVVGGQGELGKTPLWSEVDRAQLELNRPNLRFSLADAEQLQPVLGVTHGVVGTLEGTNEQLTLTYHLWQFTPRKEVGEPLTLRGTRQQLIAELPGLATALCTRLGVKTPSLPTLNTSPDDLTLIGHLSMNSNAQWTSAQIAALNRIAPREPLAALLVIYNVKSKVDVENTKIALHTLQTATGDNAQTFGVVGLTQVDKLPLFHNALTEARKRFPNNMQMNFAEAMFLKSQSEFNEARKASERMVQDSIESPFAWWMLAGVMSEQAQGIRTGRLYSALSSEENALLNQAYPAELRVILRGLQLDPHNARTWLRVSVAAAFAGRRALEQRAFWNALRLEKANPQTFWWGLELFQGKWGGDDAKLEEIANLAAKTHFTDVGSTTQVADELATLDYHDQRAALLNGTIADMQATLAKDPNDLYAYSWLVTQYQRVGKSPDALKVARQAVEKFPQNVAMNYLLARMLWLNSQTDEAEKVYRQTLHLAPDHFEAHFDLAGLLRLKKQWEEAIREYQEVLRLSPAHQEANEFLCDALMMNKQYDAAVLAAQKALRLRPASFAAHRLLGKAYLLSKRYDESVAEFREALRLNPTDTEAKEKLQEALNP